MVVTYINSERRAASYPLQQLAVEGCCRAVRERLEYASTVLREFAELDTKDK